MCFPRFRPGCHDLIGSFPARARSNLRRGLLPLSGLGQRRLAEFHPKWHTEKAEGPAIT
jgi:hypothetical protein